MKIDLGRIEAEPLRINERFELPPDRLDPAVVAGPVEVYARIEISETPPGHRLTGRLSMSGSLRCARCLAPVDWSAEEDVDVHLVPREAAPDEEELELTADDLEVRFVGDNELSLMDVMVEQTLLAMPMRILCRESCAGVCPICGADLNQEGACSCQREIDPRWAALADISGKPS